MAVWSPTGSGNVHIDTVLTNVSVGWPNNALVAENLFPTVRVNKQAGKYYIFGREAWLAETSDYRAPGTEANEIPGFTVSLDTFYAQEHALQMAVTDEEREMVDNQFTPDRDATNLLTSKIWLGRELAMYNLVSVAASYASGLSTTLAGTAQWSDYTGASHPIKDVRTGFRAVHAKIFMEPNTAIIPYLVMSYLEDHPDIIARIQYSERAILTPEIIAAVFGIQTTSQARARSGCLRARRSSRATSPRRSGITSSRTVPSARPRASRRPSSRRRSSTACAPRSLA
jgi:hypothetical protein